MSAKIEEWLVNVAALVGALFTALKAGKFASGWMGKRQTASERETAAQKRWDLRSFEAIVEAQRQEIARCREEKIQLQVVIAHMEDEAHRSRQTIMRANEYLLIFALELGKPPPDLEQDPPKLGA